MLHAKMSVLFSRERISAEIDRMAAEINRDYHGREILAVGILKGSFLFIADLVRKLEGPVVVDFMRLASYGAGTRSSGTVEFRKDLEIDIEGKDVLIIEDIVDSGLTLDTLVANLRQRQPRSLKICTLIDKTAHREGKVVPDYKGITMESGFIVGYGLDYNEAYRNLPDIYVMQED